MAVPLDNAYAMCWPVDDGTGRADCSLPGVRAMLKDVHPWTGFLDASGRRVYDMAHVRHDGHAKHVRYDHGTYVLAGMADEIPLRELSPDGGPLPVDVIDD